MYNKKMMINNNMRCASFGEDVIPEEEEGFDLSRNVSLDSSRPYGGALDWMHVFNSHEMHKIFKTKYSEYR